MTTLAWVLALGLVLVLEVLALIEGEGTLSANIWKVRAVTYRRVILYPLWAWLTWHWMIDADPAYGAGDAVSVLVGLLWGLLAGARRTKEES